MPLPAPVPNYDPLEGQAIPEGVDARAEHKKMDRLWRRRSGALGWLATTNHKDIGIRYIVTAFIFFGIAGLLAAAMRFQLAFPEHRFLGPDTYNQFFSTHGSAMMFLFAVPIMEGMALYLIPLMVGTRNVAFPRLNAFGYWAYVGGGLMLYGGLLLNIGPDAGWFAYTPLSGPEFSPGKRVDFWSQMISMTEVSALVAAVEIICTVMKQRAPGMSLNRIPIYVWAMMVTAFMIIFAMPSIMLASGMLAMDRMINVNTHFFNHAEGGDSLLWQHLFWFFGHPEVYIIFIPATGFVSAILPVFCRRIMFGYTALVLSLVSVGFIGFGLWVHHMFATPLPRMGQAFFTSSSMMIAIPNGIQIFCWLATLWAGRPRFKTPMLWVAGFVALFVLGGLTGMILASVSLDRQVHDTYFVVAHFHYVLIGGAVFPLMGAIYYWFPKWTGRMMSETAGKWNFWLFFIGFNVTFFPMHILGIKGMPRRVYTYLPETGWGLLNLIASLGSAVIFVSVVVFIWNVLWSRKHGELAGANPWGADTLEWGTASPPPVYNFLYPRTVNGRAALWEETPDLPVVVGINGEKREVLNTTILGAAPEHKYELCTDSIWPFVTAFMVFGSFLGVIFHPWAFPLGVVFICISLVLWFWRENEPPGVLPLTEEEEEEEMRRAGGRKAPPGSVGEMSAEGAS